MTHPKSRAAMLAHVTIVMAALWLVTGALFKLFAGSPNMLPEVVRKHTPFDWDLTFRLVIPVELTIAWVAIFVPRIGWWLIALVFVFFEFLLAQMIAAGAESCGCLGNAIKLSPALMMAIDAVLLVAMLATRPWSALEHGTSAKPIAAVVLLSAIAWISPWLVIPAASGVTIGRDGSTTSTSPRYIYIQPEKWTDLAIFDVAELTQFVPAEKLPTDGLVVLWRQACDHCAEHLREMATADKGEKPIVLLQLMDDLESTRAVDAMPSGQHVTHFTTPENVQITVETPWVVHVEGGIITRVEMLK